MPVQAAISPIPVATMMADAPNMPVQAAIDAPVMPVQAAIPAAEIMAGDAVLPVQDPIPAPSAPSDAATHAAEGSPLSDNKEKDAAPSTDKRPPRPGIPAEGKMLLEVGRCKPDP